MDYNLRKNASHGSLCVMLLPFCLLPFAMKNEQGVYPLLFIISLGSCISSLLENFKQSKANSSYTNKISYIIVSMSLSLFVWHFFSYGIILSFATIFISLWYYSYLIKNVLINCPGSFTLGEAQIIAQSVMLFSLCCAISFLSEFNVQCNFPIFQAISESVNCLQILILGSILLMHTLYMIPVLRSGIQFFICCFIVLLIMIFTWHATLKENIFSWLWFFCFDNKKRISLITFWLISTFVSIMFVIVVNQKKNPKATTSTRKYFHLIITAVYIPGIMYDLELLRLASCIALTVFILLEVCRVLNVQMIGPTIENAFQVFLDEKDSGTLILTHIYLLVGCSSPVWLSGYISGDFHINLLSGVISVGFGDTAAAVGGTLFGKHHWKGSKKTFEGSICALTVQLIVSLFFLYLGHAFSAKNILLVIVTAFLTTLLEAKTTQVDNLVLPLFMFSFLSWIQ